MNPSTVEYLSTIDEQETFLRNLIISNKRYDHIYVSIGGKFNEPTVYFRQTSQHYPTNALNQLIPEFLRNSSDSHNLIIVIDEFLNQPNIDMNCQLLKSSVASAESTMDVVILNTFISFNENESLSIDATIETILHLAKTMNISSKNVMMCNYIAFSSPNQYECKFEENIPIQLQKIFNRPHNSEYSECFYQWYGMTLYFYNLIYKYKNYCTMKLIFISELLHLCDIMKFAHPICKEDISNIIENISSSDRHHRKTFLLRKLQMFNANTVDITSAVY